MYYGCMHVPRKNANYWVLAKIKYIFTPVRINPHKVIIISQTNLQMHLYVSPASWAGFINSSFWHVPYALD